jgi:beta-phosphoglucomutase-like phosphatase (HAD superfamily)
MPLELDTAASHWQLALDASETALLAEAGTLSAAELAGRRTAAHEERRKAAAALVRLAHTAHVHPEPWLADVPVTHEQLSLPAHVEACVFDLDGVLTDSGLLHAWAWGRVFDEFLQQHSERAHWTFIPFDRDADYRSYLDGRPRLEGVHAFLASRGIRLPEGRANDPAGAPTAHGLARLKQETLSGGLHERGLAAVPGARRYLEAAGHAGLKRAVVSSSTSTCWMLELAGLTTVVDTIVDGHVIHEERLRSRPAPDVLMSACRHLDVDPGHSVSFTHTPAGIAAARSAGITVIEFTSLEPLLAPSLARL